MQLIYASRPFGYDDLTLTSILFQARENNARAGITGALICREDLFLQILEGPRDLVTSTFSRILRDERHVDVVSLLTSDIDRRLFPKWSMRHDPARSWMWTPEEVAMGAIGRASDQEIRGIFERLARDTPKSVLDSKTYEQEIHMVGDRRDECRSAHCGAMGSDRE